MSSVTVERANEIIEAHKKFLNGMEIDIKETTSETEADLIIAFHEMLEKQRKASSRVDEVDNAIVSSTDLEFEKKEFDLYGARTHHKPIDSYENNNIKKNPKTGKYYCVFNVVND